MAREIMGDIHFEWQYIIQFDLYSIFFIHSNKLKLLYEILLMKKTKQTRFYNPIKLENKSNIINPP